MKAFLFSIAVVCLLLVSAAFPIQAAWIDNGVPVCAASNNQENQVTASDGVGGMFVAWVDSRAADKDIYAQHIDASGAALWTPYGIPVCTEIGNQIDCVIVSDGVGGAIIVWEDLRNGTDFQLFAQRVSSSGLIQWGPDGILLSTTAVAANRAGIVTDGANGAIIAWEEWSGVSWDIYAQRVGPSGDLLWGVSGTPVCSNSSPQYFPRIAVDEAGGAVICWREERAGNLDIYAQRVNAAGNVLWTVDGVPACQQVNSQQNADIASDGSGGAIVVWEDVRNSSDDIYAQRIYYTGAAAWTLDGIPVAGSLNSMRTPMVMSDGGGGAFIVWREHLPSEYDMHAQRVDAAGALLWTSSGVPVVTAFGYQYYPAVVSDGYDGILVSWMDFRGAAYDIYSQRISAAGDIIWAVDGIPVCTADRDQNFPSMVSDGAGGALIAWKDSRSAVDSDIYAYQIDSQGRRGYRAPVIDSVQDVPGDEGGWVNVAWYATPFDYVSGEITEYSVWRALETPAALNMIEAGATVVNDPSDCLASAPSGGKDRLLRTSTLNGEAFFWEIASIAPAYRLEGYSAITGTRFDSTAVSTENHYFQIIAHTSDPGVFYVSESDSGYSVDNLAPGAPLGLAGEQLFSPEGLQLTWDPNTEPDLAGYKIYRGTTSGFSPGPGNFVASTPDTFSVDGDWDWSTGYWYKVAAVDIHGNESIFAVVGPEMVTGDDPMPAPDATFLAQNYPNPFNPTTEIAFGLKSDGFVNLSIYNAAGQLVTVLINESRPAGPYAAVWNGKAENGTTAASGVYFYRLITKEFEETKKMILLR